MYLHGEYPFYVQGWGGQFVAYPYIALWRLSALTKLRLDGIHKLREIVKEKISYAKEIYHAKCARRRTDNIVTV